MPQAAFLSALAGKEVAELAAHAAVTALSEIGAGITKGNLGSLLGGAEGQGISHHLLFILLSTEKSLVLQTVRKLSCQLLKKGVCLK